MVVAKLFCFLLPLRTGCLVIGLYDIVYGVSMTLLYLLSMYSGYFNVSGYYEYALWLDLIFTIFQLFGGFVLIYAVKNSTLLLLLTYVGLGVVLIGADIAGDVLLALTYSYETLETIVPAAILLLIFIGIRSYMIFTVYMYYKEQKGN